LDPRHAEGDLPEGDQAVAGPFLHHGIPHGERLVRGDPHFVAEVAGEAGAGNRYRHAGDFGGSELEISEVFDLRSEGGEDDLGPGPLEGEGGVGVGDVFDLDAVVADQGGEVGEVGKGARKNELVVRMTEHHAVLDHVTVVVTPDRVLRPARAARADVTGENPGEVS